MAKKPLTLSIFIPVLASIAVNFLLTVPTNASTIINNIEYWSIPELTSLKTEVELERNTLCQGDFDCEEEFYWSLWERGDEYIALDMLNSAIFMVTNINLERETITLRYAPYEDPWMRQFGIIQEPDEAGELYLFWLDAGMNDPTIYMHYTNDYVDQIKNGDTEEGLHTILAKNHFIDGENWLPIGEEVEFSIAGSNLASSPRAIIFDKLISTDPDRTILMGSINFQECLDSPDYRPGMDCRLMVSGTHGRIYVPTEYEEPQVVTGLGGINSLPSETLNYESENNVVIPKAPDTGAVTTKEQRTIEYLTPIAIALSCAFLGILLILWPKTKKSVKNKYFSKKYQKKSKKTLDIFRALR